MNSKRATNHENKEVYTTNPQEGELGREHSDEPETVEIEPERLARGTWCTVKNRYVGQGDISAAYCGDRVPEGRIRSTFSWRGAEWVRTGGQYHHGKATAKAYRIVPLAQFDGPGCTFQDRHQDGDAARKDPNGFYHGVRITHRKQPYVLCGPPVVFVEGEPAQMVLFED